MISLPSWQSSLVVSSSDVIAHTPSVCVLSRPASDFFWEAAHIYNMKREKRITDQR